MANIPEIREKEIAETVKMLSDKMPDDEKLISMTQDLANALKNQQNQQIVKQVWKNYQSGKNRYWFV